MKIAVITSCSKTKLDHPGPAWLVNRGQLLRMVIDYTNLIGGHLFILSAKYGLIDSDMYITPYNRKLKNKSDVEKIRNPSNETFDRILKEYDRVIIILGKVYRSVLRGMTNEKITIIEDIRGIGGLYQKVAGLIRDASVQNYEMKNEMGEIIDVESY